MSSVTRRHNHRRGRVQSARDGQTSAPLQPCSGIATSWQGWGEDTLGARPGCAGQAAGQTGRADCVDLRGENYGYFSLSD